MEKERPLVEICTPNLSILLGFDCGRGDLEFVFYYYYFFGCAAWLAGF